jgi:hypothetical protein
VSIVALSGAMAPDIGDIESTAHLGVRRIRLTYCLQPPRP